MPRNAPRPNILFVMVDELAPQATPLDGHPVVKAPHLAQLARQGVVFDRAYTNSPLCAPARASMLAGQLTPAIAAWDNGAELASSVPTLAHYLRHLGYHCSLAGKMHFIGADQLHGFEERLTTDIYPANFAWTANWSAPGAPSPAGLSMRPVMEAGPCVRNMQIDYDDEVEFVGVRKLYDLAREPRRQPFFLTVSFTQPHPPFVTGREHWSRYDAAEIDLPRVPPIPVDQLDAFSKSLYYNHRRDRYTVTDEHVRNARHAYYGMISCIDDKLGRLLSVLEETGFAENTIVVFTADHGEMLGERGMWLKMCMFEWSVRVPLVLAWPGHLAPRRVAANVSLVDLLPTLVDLARGDSPPPPLVDRLDGRSMRALLCDGRDAQWSDTVISDFNAGGAPGPLRMVKQGSLKYIHLHGHPPLLYDLAADPDELDNLAGRPAWREAQARLHAIAMDGYDPGRIHEQVLASQRRRLFIKGLDESSELAGNWAFEARPGDAKRYVRGAGLAGGEHATKARARYPFVPAAAEDAS